ncbi:unnamed protein product [Trichobilharzia regenti]|nr:unnamed protein product [Trichobilharzia regenti]
MKALSICEKEPKLSTAVIKEFANDEFDHTNRGKVNICDNDHDSALLSLVDHDEMRGMPTTAELNKRSVQRKRGLELKADAVAEGIDTCETVGANDQRVAHLSSDASSKPELIIKVSSGGNLSVRQPSKSRTTTASDPPLSSSTGISQSPLVLSSTMKKTPINSSVLCYDYDSINPFKRTKVNGQFREDKPNVCESVTAKLTCTNKGISSFKLLSECYYFWCKLLRFHTWLVR